MKKVIKILKVFVITAVVGFLLISCGDEKDNGNNNGSNDKKMDSNLIGKWAEIKTFVGVNEYDIYTAGTAGMEFYLTGYKVYRYSSLWATHDGFYTKNNKFYSTTDAGWEGFSYSINGNKLRITEDEQNNAGIVYEKVIKFNWE